MPKTSKASKTKTRTRAEKLPSEKRKISSKDMTKVKGGIWLPGNYVIADPKSIQGK